MINEPWLKLYKKIGDHPIMRDHNALAIFIWLLTHVDKDGKKTISRYQTASILGMKPSTFYGAASRLTKKKYNVAEVIANKDYTEVRLLHWAKYQPHLTSSEEVAKSQYKNAEESPTLIKDIRKEIRKRAIGNPILEDPLFKRYLEVKNLGDDSAVRFKMSALPALDRRYPKWKFQSEWNEAAAVMKQTN